MDLFRNLTPLNCKTVPVLFTDQCQKSFDILKEALMKSSIVVYPDTNGPYTLFTDASKYALSKVLKQEYTTSIDC